MDVRCRRCHVIVTTAGFRRTDGTPLIRRRSVRLTASSGSSYSILQAAEALGVAASTVSPSVVPLVKTIELESGRVLIPVDELERILAERRRPVSPRPLRAPVGRPPAVPARVAERIRAEHAAGE
jgi:hypothetical protein